MGGPYPRNSELRPQLLKHGWGPWAQGIICMNCHQEGGHMISAPLNGLRNIDSVALDELFNWDGEHGLPQVDTGD